jgi:thioredoxin reductase (NADPH)
LEPVLVLYSRAYCHLCEAMLDEIESVRGEFAFRLSVVDVDSDPGLERRFGELVPLLAHGEHELARYRLDSGLLRAYLSRFR